MPKNKSGRKGLVTGKRVVGLNSVSIRRTQEVREIPIEDIVVPDWMGDDDPIFSCLYRKYITGKISGFLTRVPMNFVREGFFLASRGFEYRCDQPPEDVVRQTMREIRGGGRPSLHLYSNLNASSDVRFMCPDDVAVCLAYRKLGFGAVPAVVLSPGKDSLPFSSFETRVDARYVARGANVRGIVSASVPKKIPSITGIALPEAPAEMLDRFQKELARLVGRLRLFHAPSPNEMHYHHMVFSALVRMQETLRAIQLLLEQELWYQALSLLRVLYEIHLNFCFDWMQPETNYRYLAAAAVFDNKEVSRQKEVMSNDLVSKGVARDIAVDQAGAAWKPVALASNVSEKAKLSKIGIMHHRDIYEFLSQITHQNFEVASLHANRFNDEDFLIIDDSVRKTYLRFMDLIVSEFAFCVDQDIGVAIA